MENLQRIRYYLNYMPGNSNFGFVQNLGIVNNIFQRIYNRLIITKNLPLSLPEFTLIFTIDSYPGMSQYRLSKLSGYSKQRCHQIVGRLIESGYVEQESRENKTRSFLTSQGRMVLFETVNSINSYLETHLSEEQILVFQQLRNSLKAASSILLENVNIQHDLKLQ